MPLWMATPSAPPPEAAPWIELEPAPPLPSALDEIVPSDTTTEGSAPVEASLRARWYVRPRAAVTVLDVGWHPDLGIAVGHQWWKFTDVAVAPAGETRLVATLPLGEPGYDLSLDAVGGAWLLDRFGLLAGVAIEADRIRWSALRNDRSLGLGPTARVAIQLGIVTPWAEAASLWTIDGDRLPLADAPWDAFRTRAGLLFGRRFQLRVDGAHTATGSGERWEASAGVHLHLG